MKFHSALTQQIYSYRAIKEGRLSRSSDGQFDVSEVIRCEAPQEVIKKDDADLRQLVDFMKREIEAYKDREQRDLDRIDRFQLLLGHKASPDNSSHDTTMTQTNGAPRDKVMTHHKKNQKNEVYSAESWMLF